MQRVDARFIHEASGLEEWALTNWTDEAKSLLFSHGGTPRKAGGGANVPNFRNDCAEFDIASVEKGCILLTQTNSKALPYHVIRYRRNADSKWEL
mmetsp:Transcript_4046/g.6208  ORF Transcript_4046/g.6208 Transcript_4046/m.6208 type:complete len:95 (+) Transcript_4046:1550-1834(+)